MNRLYRTISIITILVIVSPQHLNCSTLPNCLVCSASAQCFKCSQGYLLQQKKCLAQAQKKSPTEQNLFQNLKLRRYLTEGTQDSQQGKRLVRFGSQGNSQDKNCLFQWKGVCVQCGFKWEMGIGAECLPRFDECLKFSQFMCAECNPMFFQKNGQCIDQGCATDNYYHCNNCKPGFKMTKYGHCEVQNCKTYQNGTCKSCLSPFILISEFCVLPIRNCQSQSMIGCQKCSPQFHPINSNTECKESSPLCLQYLIDGTCKQCKFPQLILLSGKCVDPNCITADHVYGYCLTCGVGYQVDKDKVCRLNFQDINCLRVNVNVCLECKEGFFVGGEGKCQALPENCIQQTCKYCKKGFISINGKCVGFQNCKKLSPNNFCLICNQGYALTTIGTCTKSIPVCLQYSVSGCSKCPPNYILDSTPNCKWNPSFKDPNCLANNYKNECVLCRNRFRLSPKFNNLCLYINTQCKTSNAEGQCTSCYQGYQLNQYMGDCVQSIPILNCAAQSQGRCIRCSDRFFLVNAVTCKEVDMLCNQYDRDFGFCTTCYDGYVLNGKRCELPLAMNTNPTPALLGSSSSQSQTTLTSNLTNCRTLDEKNTSRCAKCFESYYISKKDGTCLKIDSLCKTFNENDGSCLSCYEGYRVVGTTCKMQNFRNDNQIITYTLNCRKPDHPKRECLECVDRFIKDGANCKQVSSLCNTFNKTTGECLTCYQGYILSKSSCIPISSLTVNLQNCEKPSLTLPITCLACSTGYYWKDDHCQKVSILCATSNSKGQCLTCIQGYFKNDENTCIMAALGFDHNCQKYDNNGYCIKCKSSSKLENFLCV